MKPHAIIDTNNKIVLDFTKKAQQFLGLPRSILEAQAEQKNPDLYQDAYGKKAVSKAKQSLKLLKRVERELQKLEKHLAK